MQINIKYSLIIAVVGFTINCLSQTVVPIYKADMYQSGVYYKDTYNDFDKFVGTWKYTNGNTSLTIVLQKKLQQPVNDYDGTYYDMDCIIGAYKYIENGVEKINTIPQLSEDLDIIYYYIDGYTIVGSDSVYCLNCGPNDRVLLLSFTDPDRDIEGYEPEMLFRRADNGGAQKLELDFRTIYGGWEEEGVTPQYTKYTVPFGKYTLTKIN